MSEYLKTLLGESYKDDLTLDELSDLLESQQSNAASELERYKKAITKANAEAKQYKDQLKSKQSADENALQDLKDQLAQLTEMNKTLTAEKELQDRTARYMDLGYDKVLAADTAKALIDGDLDKVFSNQAKFIKSREDAAIAQKMQDTPKPGASGDVSGGVNYQEMAAKALENGDGVAAAYYTRLAQETQTQA
jgi:chromosome segregation ATPase